MPPGRVAPLIALFAFVLSSATAHAASWQAPAGPDVPARSKPGTPLAARGALNEGALRSEIEAALRSVGGADGAWVFDVDAGRELFADDATRRLIPASNQKLFTTAAFLDHFGPDARLKTRVYARGALRERGRRLTVAGNLVIVGDGDPAFGTESFANHNDQPVTKVSTLARAIAAAGVRRITGRVLADDSIFDRKRRAGPYLSPLSGLSFNNGIAGGDYASDPELVAAKQLARALRKRGIRVTKRIGRANLAPPALEPEPLALAPSPPVSTLIEETNSISNNFFAEMLLKRLGAEGGKGTRKRGAAKVEAFARREGTDLHAVDGSGLSRRNAVSPQEVGRLLVAVARDQRDGPAFARSLATAGREGTLGDRMEGTAAEGACVGKTGTLDGVSALSGYCEANGHTIAFSTLFNDTYVDGARDAQDRIAIAIARYAP
jgi:serine-type D-Ala-D-Ala carboxypeptidase/endopeptidase (penicillin-binding protein 4)